MNPMQGPRSNGGSSTDVNQADGESIYCTETNLSNILNPADTGFPNNSIPSGRPTYASSSSHAAQEHNWWRLGESSSSDQVNSIGMKTNHQLPQDASHHFVGYGSEGRQLGLNSMLVHGEVHAGSHIRNGPSFLRGSSSNPITQHVDMSMDMDSDNCIAQTSGVVNRHNSYGSSLGSSIQAAGESSSGPASSFGGWGSSCKRKALEGSPSHSLSGETPNRLVQSENSASHRGLAQYGASSSLSLATPSQSSPNVTNHFGRTEQMFGSGGGRAVAASAFHSTRNTDTLSRAGRRSNPRQPQESIAFSISHAGTSVPPTGSLQQNLPLNAPFVDPIDVRSTPITSGSTGENQTNIVHLPALTRNIHQFAWDASFSSRASSSSGIGMPAEQVEPQWETSRSNPEQPLFVPATDMRHPEHDLWSFTHGYPGSSIDPPFVPRAGPSSDIHVPQPSPSWIPPQSASLNIPSRTSELSPWSLFPSIESQSASHGASLPLLPAGPSVPSNEVTVPSGSSSRSHRSRQRRSGMLLERQNELLHRHLGRSLAADSNGRNQIISEIRQVLHAMRRGENLRVEDYMVLDPLIYQGMTDLHDRHREMRLDVDNMSYEELLALGERIGDVSTGLSEEVILKAMKQHKHTSSSAELHQDIIEPCCICQEEYVEGDNLGTLKCGHEFHKDCIKQWVMIKNLCPICKTEALKTP
ncbi:PREDICTED: E3 ubiquitin-protein ligase MBR1-like [Camelina sativa]|uniref:RING-type E3 ubiquitin transferase n=1 Tax=Camelina sativa TaxID=90675 RepID=A0ABM1RDM8_CAMSA|nr:PREDICTED: E3 ubiquitin-protein ligase MBR1-like [Camelina sativa]XP_019097116.1 PREDICTED: E3 ubiquitin-protein ligase MBR1-like [Camelina sativa]XP_019097117.1 PREDICTED: E3 ubiquitin-protein ligase MBR1-like [Camelina sativa]